MIDADAKPATSGLAPRVEMIAETSEPTNSARARQCPSVALDASSPGETMISVYVHVDAELDDDSARAVAEAIAQTARRVRWKSNTAMVEVNTRDVATLAAIRHVGYVETGLSLSAPKPTSARLDRAPDAQLRRVTKCQQQHKNGEGVLVGIIDVHGFDFAHPDFLDETRHTRFEAIWDQGGVTRPPPPSRAGDKDGYQYGSLILKRHMDAAIDAAPVRRMAATSLEPQSQMVPGSHGTHVASIAAGNRGVARNARLAAVLIDLSEQSENAATSFYDSTRVTDAVDYLLDLATELGGEQPLPVSINISLGTNGHAHDSTSPTAQWIDHALSTRGRAVAVASGNSGQTEAAGDGDRGFIKGRIHASGKLRKAGLPHDLAWIVEGTDHVADVSENEMEIWYEAQDRFEVAIRPPGGTWSAYIKPTRKAINKRLGDGTRVSIVNETYYPENGLNRISIILSPRYPRPVNGAIPQPKPITAGQWTVRLRGIVVRDGTFHAWIERDDARRRPGSGNLWDFPSYFAPGSYTDDSMINSLACPNRVIAVANIDVHGEKVNVSSSRGPTRDGRCKPDIGADGTDVVAACGFHPRSEWIAMTGTSMASPYVCGVAALMLAAHPRLTAAQIQGIIRATSAPLIGYDFDWRKDAGFGLINPAGCVEAATSYKAKAGK
ncbi:S8 family serine peptidase [Mycolicibacterium wolinskyi]|uniref:S8 family serine peptidase n=1 Tax=Mycolicibacterium wolinskyi TaxID=59750 RepID=UPI00082F4156|nr:S8 family serine peptidase [Mycolicibacterium wolinskyi]